MSLTGAQGYGQDDGVMADRLEQVQGSALASMAWWIDHVLAPLRAGIRARDPHAQVYSEEAVQGLADLYARSCHTRASIVAGRAVDVSDLPSVAGLLLLEMAVSIGRVHVPHGRPQGLTPQYHKRALNGMRTAICGAQTECLDAARRAERYDYWLEEPFSRDLRRLAGWFGEARIIMRGLQVEMRSAK